MVAIMRRFALLVIVGVYVLAVAAGAKQTGQADAQALQRMVATERAFAAATAEVGVRDGFLAFFADDSVQIQRGDAVTLTPARDALASQALPKLPLVNQLLWEPFTGHVSSDGTLGWLTGAFVVFNQAQKTPIGQGAYFSVWKRQADGTWRVWLDEGIRLPQIWQNASPFRVAPEPDPGKTGAANESVADAERAMNTDARAPVTVYAERLGADARFHRDGLMPIVGRDAIVEWMRAHRSTSACRVLQTESAASGDLAIAIGACTPSKGKPASYVRVWKRDVTGKWRIVFQTENEG
jgi:ketosteroid isomerase-like protein